MNDKELDKQFSTTSIEDMKTLLEKQMLLNKIMTERQQEMETELTKRREIDPFLKKLLGNQELMNKLAEVKL